MGEEGEVMKEMDKKLEKSNEELEMLNEDFESITLDDLEELEEVVCPSSNGCCGCC